MTIYNFEGFICGVRGQMRQLLHEGYDQNEMTKFLGKCLGSCTNAFEEKTLEENLKEEFSDYLEMVKAA